MDQRKRYFIISKDGAERDNEFSITSFFRASEHVQKQLDQILAFEKPRSEKSIDGKEFILPFKVVQGHRTGCPVQSFSFALKTDLNSGLSVFASRTTNVLKLLHKKVIPES